MLISGLFGVIAGAILLSGTPTISAWLLGLLIGLDLISHGIAWLFYAFTTIRTPARW
jgi:uncharacterized membrane protein HdeD (DUF308 family)